MVCWFKPFPLQTLCASVEYPFNYLRSPPEPLVSLSLGGCNGAGGKQKQKQTQTQKEASPRRSRSTCHVRTSSPCHQPHGSTLLPEGEAQHGHMQDAARQVRGFGLWRELIQDWLQWRLRPRVAVGRVSAEALGRRREYEEGTRCRRW